ncbi:MAG: beta-propeller domain-containing protein, partial [Acidimicrobiia bacterium]
MKRTALVIALMLAACSPVAIDDPDDPTPPAIVGSAFQTFSNCDDLLDYYVSNAVDMVGPYGLGGHFRMFDDMAEAAADDAGGDTGGGSERSFTESNNQVSGVDEIDIVKTDGNRIYTVVDGVLRVGTVGDPGITMAGSLAFGEWWPQGILLQGDTVIAVGQIWGGDVT